MRVIFLGGEPASGKSSVAWDIFFRLRTFSKWQRFDYQKVSGHFFPSRRTWVIGKYWDTSEKFAGTDRLSMAVLPDAIEFLSTIPRNDTVFIEGDRLANARFFRAICEYDAQLFFLESSARALAERHAARADTQSEIFKKSRRTKWNNLRAQFEFVILSNEKPLDLSICADRIWQAMMD